MAMLNQKVVLASTSPRRRELVNIIFSEVECIGSDCDETITEVLSPEEICMRLAQRKAEAVYENLDSKCLTLGCDTVVDLDGEVLGKPEDEADAIRMLSMLQNKSHKVHTGVCLIDEFGEKRVFCSTSCVTFETMTVDEMKTIIREDKVLDKAGAYAIQGVTSAKVKEIRGEYFNIVGLPVAAIYSEMNLWKNC